MAKLHTRFWVIGRILVLSLFFFIVGIFILAHGLFYTVIYYSEPIDLTDTHHELVEYSRVKINEYSVVGNVESYGHVYFLIEYAEDRYIWVRSTKNDYIYQNLIYAHGGPITEHAFCLDGCVEELSDKEYKRIIDDYNYTQFNERISKYKINFITDSSIVSIVFGASLILIMPICIFFSIKVFQKDRMG